MFCNCNSQKPIIPCPTSNPPTCGPGKTFPFILLLLSIHVVETGLYFLLGKSNLNKLHMRHRLLNPLRVLNYLFVTGFLVCSFTLAADPPEFIDPVPDDLTIDCLNDFPDPVSLMATDDDDPAFPMSISSVDSPDPNVIDPCIGGIVTRTWTATDAGGESLTLTQIITVLPDIQPPNVLPPDYPDTVACDEKDYELWIDTKRLIISFFADDDCSGLNYIIDDAPTNPMENCGTLEVTFTVADNCGLTSEWLTSLTLLDTVPPKLDTIPPDLDLSCTDSIPDPWIIGATDNCADSLIVTFSEIENQVADSTCTEYEYVIYRTWTTSDSCGNTASTTQTITVSDNESPFFTRPPNIVIPCEVDPHDLSVTGDVTDLADNCDPFAYIFYNDVIIPGDCNQTFTILRNWIAKDTCGNVTGKSQRIEVVDANEPYFNVPPDITVSCEDADDFVITGWPTGVYDVCDTFPQVSFVDIITPGFCVNEYGIRRVWHVEDNCGNFTEKDQIIQVIDETKPIFDPLPQDMTLHCGEGQDFDLAFANWIADRGGAAANDNCTPDEIINWYLYNSGTSDPASLAAADCSYPLGILRMQAVDFIIEDECGNRDTSTAVFTILDNVPPVITQCPSDTILPNDPGLCSAVFALPPPMVEESCSLDTLFEQLNVVVPSSEKILKNSVLSSASTDNSIIVSWPSVMAFTGSGALTDKLIFRGLTGVLPS